ncbi:MAG: hypothetical protein ACOYOK_00260 [Pseudobdellovibrionaceae bacterium]
MSFVLFCNCAFADTDRCTSPTIIKSTHLTNPVDSKRSSSIEFKYRYIKGADNYPVVIKIPGGPGGTAINNDPNPSFDPRVGWIQIDPRNTGCNSINLPIEFVTTQIEVYDILQIIKDLKLNNYVLFGTSYGTVVATQLAVEAEKQKLPGSRMVILEGVLGRSFNDLEQEKSFAFFWNLYKQKISTTLLEELKKESPFSIPSEAWGKYFSQMLYLGTHPEYGDIGLMTFKMLEDPKTRSIILDQVKAKSIDTDHLSQVFQSISCSDLVENAGDVDFKNANMIPYIPANNVCKHTKLNKYDSAKFQISAPIVYFNGSNDPATPIAQAKYHFLNQKSKTKTFVEVVNGGHSALTVNLSDCYSLIMNSLILNTVPLRSAISTCKLTTNLTE